MAEPPGAPHRAVSREHMVRHTRMQADYCGQMGSPLYAHLLARVADDIEGGGPCAEVLAGHEGDRGPSALALRFMAGVHRLVLQGRAPGLAAYYPSAGGTGATEDAWAPFVQTVAANVDELRGALALPPQTNEVGRSASLVGGLAYVVAEAALPLRLRELGCSAGLNLRGDRYRLVSGEPDARVVTGPADSPVVLTDAWRGVLPPAPAAPLPVVDRVGCDPNPVDPTTEDGRLLLTSYVWPDQADRLARLRGALLVAADVPAVLERTTARDFMARLELARGTTTVVWHSVMWQYLGSDEQQDVLQRLEQLGAGATDSTRLAHLSLEPRRRSPESAIEALVVLRTWPGEERVLGSASAHGLPVVWEAPGVGT